MARKAAVFNGAVLVDSSASVSYSRPGDLATAAGSVALAQIPEFADEARVCLPPSPITLDTDATALNQVFGGLWSDGGNCVVHYRQRSSPNSAFVNIWPNLAIVANCLTGQPASRSTNIRCTASGNKTTSQVDILKGSPDEDANWVYAPYAFQIVQGVVLALCEAQTWTGSAWEAQAVGIVKWDESAQQWRLLLRGKTRNAGGTRGREWTASQYWILDGQPLTSSLEVMLCWADYGVNGTPVSNGGQLFVCRLSRSISSDPWTIGAPIMLYETTDTGSHHFHNAAAYRPSSTATGVAITLSVGDGTMAEQVVIYRSDSSSYDSGWDSGTKVATASATDGATQNGWTTVRKASGGPSTLSPTTPVGADQWMGVAPLPNQTLRMVLGNDEKQNCILFMNLPDPFTDATKKVWYELPARDPVPINSMRRGSLAFGLWCDTAWRRDYVAVRQKNSKTNASVVPSFGNPIAVSYSPASNFPQGFSAAVGNKINRVLYSPDGEKWGIWWSPNADLRPAVIPGFALFGSLSSYGKVVACAFPTTALRRPIKTSPATTQYQINSAAQAEAPGTGNTVASVSGSSFGVLGSIVAGRTIPAPPSNGPVIRWTVDSTATSKYAGARTLTTGTPLLISDRDPSGGATFQYVHVGLWVYALPPSIPYGGDGVAPYNSSPTSFRAQIMRANNAAASPAGAGDVDSLDGAGWRYVSFSTSTQQWGADISANVNVAMRLLDDSSGANLMDILVCFDRVSLSSSPIPLASHPPPVGASATIAPTSLDSDRLIVSGLASGAAWTVYVLGAVPDNSWDQYSPAEYYPSGAAMFTLVEGANRKISVRCDLPNRRVVVTDGTNSVSLAPLAGEEFVFERGVPISLSISGNGTAVEISGSVGNTQISTASLTLALAVRPTTVNLADEQYAPILPMNFFSVVWDNAAAHNAATRSANMQSLVYMTGTPSVAGGGTVQVPIAG